MVAPTLFEDLISRVRAGDARAAEELVRRYEPEIRREIRVRLTNPRLRRLFDSIDVCQSVLANFFARVALGQFELNDPPQLLRLLQAMARNKLADYARKEGRMKRGASLERARQSGSKLLSPEPSPSDLVGGAELVEQFRSRLSHEERQIADQRADGLQWSEIARELGHTPEAIRKRHSRAIDRVARELGLEDLLCE